MVKTKLYHSYIYLLIGFILLFFFNGRWILPIAAYLAPIFLIRFLRLEKPLKGFLLIVAAICISNMFVWKGMMPMSGFFYYLLMLIMAIFTSLTFLIDRIYSQKIKGIISTLIFPSVYVIMDYIVISTNPSGSYGTLVHTQSSLALLQLVSITGIWGVTFIITWTASIINWLWDNAFEKNKLYQTFWIYILPVIIIILYGQVRLFKNFESDTVKIASINISKTDYYDRFNTSNDSINEKINNDFLANCDIAAVTKAKIVFGIETIINLPYYKENEFVEKAKTLAQKDNIYLGLPILIIPKGFPEVRPINKITWISPKGQILFTYFKAKPTTGEGKYGDGVIRYFDSPYGRIGSAICFDMDFPSAIHQVNKMNINIMLVPGNDWKEITPYHTYVSSIRAIEQGFNMVRAASEGLSASFNYKGQILSSMDFFNTNDYILYSDVPTKGQKTLYSVFGDYFAWLCILFFISISIIFIKR